MLLSASYYASWWWNNLYAKRKNRQFGTSELWFICSPVYQYPLYYNLIVRNVYTFDIDFIRFMEMKFIILHLSKGLPKTKRMVIVIVIYKILHLKYFLGKQVSQEQQLLSLFSVLMVISFLTCFKWRPFCYLLDYFPWFYNPSPKCLKMCSLWQNPEFTCS